MKRKHILLLIILLAIGILSLAYTYLFAPEVEEISMYLSVRKEVGLSVDADAIYFGIVPPGGRGSRSLLLENDDYFPKKVKISASGELADWTRVEKNDFVLGKNESKNVKIYASPSEDAELRDYEGVLRIEFRKVYISRRLL